MARLGKKANKTGKTDEQDETKVETAAEQAGSDAAPADKSKGSRGSFFKRGGGKGKADESGGDEAEPARKGKSKAKEEVDLTAGDTPDPLGSDVDETKATKGKPAKVYDRDPDKAAKFYRHAETMAESRQYDYSIQCYIDGLRFDADNMNAHEALRDVAVRRKVAGGKPATFRERMRAPGDKVEKFLHALLLSSKDPLNLKRLLDLMSRAVDAFEAVEGLNLGEVAHWLGTMLMEKAETEKPPTKQDFLKLIDLFGRIGAWDKAVDACHMALMFDELDVELQERLRDLEAEQAMLKGSYNFDAISERGSAASVADKEGQEILDAQDQGASASDVAKGRVLAAAKREFSEDPENIVKLQQYVKALLNMGTLHQEDEAIKLLKAAHGMTGEYRHLMAIGDINIRRLTRKSRDAKRAFEADRDNEELKAAYLESVKERLRFEIPEYNTRIKQYPTDKRWRFELGKRLVDAKRYDDAIRQLQVAQEDPRYRAQALNLLGRCYRKRDYVAESLDAYRAAVAASANESDDTKLDLQYSLMTALEESAKADKSFEQAKEAAQIASTIFQTKIGYRDIDKKMDALRALVRQLQPRAGQ